MKILLLEPFFTDSHQVWASTYQQVSQHNVKILSMKGHHWKWRMHGGAVYLAGQFKNNVESYDLILGTDLLDLTTFLALTKDLTAKIPIALYFHENQITYPWSPTDQDIKLQRNNQYGFINYTSALAANRILFNSHYHYQSFLEGLSPFLKQFPDYRGLENVKKIEEKSDVLPLGLDLRRFDKYQINETNDIPIILWNHRWEYDKNPEDFFNALFQLKADDLEFKLVVLGKSYPKSPTIFAEAREKLSDHILYFDYAPDFATYAYWLWKSDISLVTSNQDFFGMSVIEAMYCHCLPILPNRLAYPEHIPLQNHSNYFYHNKKEMYQKLVQSITMTTIARQVKNCQNFVAQYDWSNLAPRYDQLFSNLANAEKNK